MGVCSAGGDGSRRWRRSGRRRCCTSSSSRGFLAGDADHGLAWPLLGVLPLFVFGMWLLTVSSARSALFIACGRDRDGGGRGLRDVHADEPRRRSASRGSHCSTSIGLTADDGRVRGLHQLVRDLPDRRPRAPVAAHLRLALLGPGARRLRSSLFAAPARRHAGGARRVSGDGIPNPFAVPALAGRHPSWSASSYTRGRRSFLALGGARTRGRSSAIRRSGRVPG